MQTTKKSARLRRALRARSVIRRLEVVRLQVHRSNRHIYAQVIDSGNRVIASASTRSKAVAAADNYTGNKESAALVGTAIAEKAIKAGVSRVAFDRSGFRYHGRIKALADKAREGGLQF
ncbi:MAG: 50S ribosomal protein L18 [Gammaproteobacteria bacterium]|nr:50S ribosomal protein L18 [Pseudomonadota bacterium]MCH9662677.1 50S ribosomal protein L18 [Gammaproteobacteria bacterium]